MGPTTDEIVNSLRAACSTQSHPQRAAALEFAAFLDGLSASQLRTGLFDASGLSDDALAFSTRLLQGALANTRHPN